MKSDIIDRVDSLVEGYVNSYSDDWTAVYRPVVEACPDSTPFMVMMRPTGVDVVFLAGENSTICNVLSGENALLHNELFLVYDGNIMKSVKRYEAEKICAKAVSRFEGRDLPVDGLDEAVASCFDLASKFRGQNTYSGSSGNWKVLLFDCSSNVGLNIDVFYDSNIVAYGYKSVDSSGVLRIDFGRFHNMLSDKTFRKVYDVIRDVCPALRLNYDEKKRLHESKENTCR